MGDKLHPIESSESHTTQLVLVTGAAGYVGSALVPQLLLKGYRVRGLDVLLYGIGAIRDWLDHPQFELVQADFRQAEKVQKSMEGVNTVVHLGAIVGDPACAINEELTFEVNLSGTRMIAEVAQSFGIDCFILASTCSVYGASDQILNENSPVNPLSIYARSKLASEQALLSMADDQFATAILRFGTIYGLSGRIRFDLVVNLLTATAVKDQHIIVTGGDQWRPFVHVYDAARAVLSILEAPRHQTVSQIFNVGSDDQNLTIQQVGEIIQHLVPQAELILNQSNGDRRNYRANFGKIRNVLGFVPEWTVERGIAQVIESITSGKVRDYRDAQYSNVKSLLDGGNIQGISPST